MPKIDDPAYDEVWTRMLALLEHESVPCVSARGLQDLSRASVRVRFLATKKDVGPKLKQLLEAYHMALEAVIHVNTLQNELQIGVLKGMLEDVGIRIGKEVEETPDA